MVRREGLRRKRQLQVRETRSRGKQIQKKKPAREIM